MAAAEVEAEIPFPIFRDIRRYYCDFCGICRSKKSLIRSHIQSHHQEELKEMEKDGEMRDEGTKVNECEECGVRFKKPAHLRQHMQSHSLERPFICPVEDCDNSYRRKDHLERHLLQHQGKMFKCPVENCNREFCVQGNIARHLKNHHENLNCRKNVPEKKKFICQEDGCGKEFEYESRLRKHEDSHVTLDSVEAICAYPGCMKPFTNKACLKAHVDACHQHVTCEVCGSLHLSKNMERHLRSHRVESSERIKCSFKDCDRTFSKKSNLQQHINSVHLERRRFVCGIPGCNKKFTFKHVRDNHESIACHGHVPGDLEEFDEQFRSRPRGGLKRKLPPIETLLRKRICPPCEVDCFADNSSGYVSWVLSPDESPQ